MRKFTTLTAFTVVVGLMALVSPALAQTTVTSFAACTGSTPIGEWCVNELTAGGTASIADLTSESGDLKDNQPLPIGAAKLTTDLTDAARAEVGVRNNYGEAGDILASLQVAYSWHKAANAGQNQNAAPSLKLSFFNPACVDLINNPGADCFGALIYEPHQNGFGNFPAVDTWNTSSVDYNNGKWWWTGGFGVANQSGGPADNTLAQWETLLSSLSSDFAGADLVFVSVGVGTFNQGQIGYFDGVQISHSFGGGFNKSYDFEPPPPPPTPVTIDIKPGSDPNSINLCSMGVIPVAIFGSVTFDVNDIDRSTLALADAGVKSAGKSGKDLCRVTDVDGDGIDDLVCQFVTVALGLTGGETTTKVVGELFDGTLFDGTDSVNIVKDECS